MAASGVERTRRRTRWYADMHRQCPHGAARAHRGCRQRRACTVERACRYADVLVHRCLSASLGLTALPDGLKDHEYMAEIVDNMNARHINAARASRSSAQLHTLLFFRTHAGMVADARVLKVQANGLIVLVPRFGIEGPVFFGDDGEANTGVTLNEAKQVRRCCGVGGCAGSLPRAHVAGVSS